LDFRNHVVGSRRRYNIDFRSRSEKWTLETVR
jgi:hypothetical protein